MKYAFLALTVFLAGCATSEKAITTAQEPLQPDGNEAPISSDKEATSSTETDENIEDTYPFLSSLSDTYLNRRNEIPAGYARIKEEMKEKETDLFEGYRVQIYSGADIALADTIAKHFRVWSSANIDGYIAETYTFFKPPHYRVHVGDFHDRERAIEFSNLLKRRFRDSWVVYDRVNPYNVPADTTMIYIIR